MFKKNESLTDRVVRGVVGILLIAGWFVWPDLTYSWAFWLGVIPLATALVGWCPIYAALGWSTEDAKKHV
jgi:hypothetical protein